MAFFRCTKCGCQEDTALCNYWSARIRATPLLCSACDPKIRRWHGEFLREFQGVLSRGGSSTEAIKMRTKTLDAAIKLADARKVIYAALKSDLPPVEATNQTTTNNVQLACMSHQRDAPELVGIIDSAPDKETAIGVKLPTNQSDHDGLVVSTALSELGAQ